MNLEVNPQNWISNIQFIIQQSTNGLDFTIVDCHHAKRSESIYVNLTHDGRLFQIRYSWHPATNQQAGLKSFDLRCFPDDRHLIKASRMFLNNLNNGDILTYKHFEGLSLVEKLGQIDENKLIYKSGQFFLNKQRVSAYLNAQLDFLQQHQLILIKFKNKQTLLSQSGQKLLDRYWDVADDHLDDPQWDLSPRLSSPREILKSLTD